MTEPERIAQKGIIPPAFWDEEVRCEFKVDESRKKLWGVQIDLLLEVAKICEKHGIPYFAISGTLIGAVRHGGIIPWDDDIDIAMFREDYERFLEICPGELKEPYFLQTTYTENDCHCDFARVLNSNTTGIRNSLKKKEHVNKGIFLDIFPIDALPEDEKKRKRLFQRTHVRTVIAAANSLNVNRSPITRAIHFLTNLPFSGFDIGRWDRKTDRIMASEDAKEAKYVGMLVRAPFRPEQVTWKKEDFAELQMLPFEFFQIPVPAGYDSILKTQYGNYMEFPPVEKRGAGHGDVIFDPDRPYTEVEAKA